MHIKIKLLFSVGFGLVALAANFAHAAEFKLRDEVRTSKSLLQLGDVAEIYAADPLESARLAALELMPTPAAGNQTRVQLREIRNLLELRGLNLTEHKFSGPSEIIVVRTSDNANKPVARRANKGLVRQAQRIAADAIVRYLRDNAADEAWQVTVEVNEEQAPWITTSPEPLPVTGGASPWVGRQSFELTVQSKEGPARLNVVAQVALPPSIVVAIHAVPRGAIVRASDIQLQRLAPGASAAGCLQSAEEAVGKEAVKPIVAGQTLDANYVRPQVMVHTGEVVTVYGRNAGIVVRLPARAHENGAQGELVTVESLLDRKSFLARVCGLQEVEVFGGAATASPAAATAERSDKSTRNE